MQTIYALIISMMLTVSLGNGCLSQPVRPDLTTDKRSSQFATEEARLAFLQRYAKLITPVQATEFHIIYHDNSGGLVAGPSDWDIRALLKVRPDDMPKWTANLQPASPDQIDLTWAKSFGAQNPAWRLTSQPQVYQKTGMVVALFAPESIVFIWSTTQF